MAVSISSSIVACLRTFNDFIEAIQDPDEEGAEGLYAPDWQDELGRLRMWAANIGAHQTGQSSLDYRLRDSSHIRQQIVKLLDEILGRIHDVRNVINEGEDEDVESLGGSSSENEGSETEIQQLRRSVATIIDCLFQMSMLLRKPARHDLRVGSKTTDVAAFEPFDYGHVRDKYPRANEALVARLSQAITRRRRHLKYRERHAMKLKQGINKVLNASKGSDEIGTEVLSETVATDFRNWNIDFGNKGSESGLSQTSYAPTLMSGGAITIPPPPKASQEGAPFECPYCYYMITITSTRSWNRHVFNDLQPYICIDAACTTPDKLYATRHEWLQHLRNAHYREQKSQAIPRAQIEERICALCRETQKTSESYNRHVARHLQELALFILPRNDDDLDKEEPNSDHESAHVDDAVSDEGESVDELILDSLVDQVGSDSVEVCISFLLRRHLANIHRQAYSLHANSR